MLLFFIGVINAGVNVAIGPLMLNATPRELIGRVQSVLLPLLRLSSILSIAVAGYLDSTILYNFAASLLGLHFHAVDTIFLVAGVLIGLGGIYALVALRGQSGLSLPPDVSRMPAPVGRRAGRRRLAHRVTVQVRLPGLLVGDVLWRAGESDPDYSR